MSVNLLRRPAASGISVKIVAMGRGVTNYVAIEPVTLAHLLGELGVGAEMDVRVNGVPVERAYRLADGDQVLVVPKIRGG